MIQASTILNEITSVVTLQKIFKRKNLNLSPRPILNYMYEQPTNQRQVQF